MKNLLDKQIALIGTIVLAIIVVILALPCFPALDGAAHLYNAQVLKDILFSDSPLTDAYRVNPIPVPNYFDHVFQALLLVFVNPLLAQKIMVVVLILASSILFLSIKPNHKNAYLWLAFVPLLFSYFLFAGMSNQVFSFIVFLAFVIYFNSINYQPKSNPKHLAILFGFSLLLWSTSILGFCLAFGIYAFGILGEYKSGFWKNTVLTTLVLSPTIFLSVIFILNAHMSSNEPFYSVFERLIRLIDLNALRTFGLGGESYILPIIGILYFFLLAHTIYKIINSNQGNFELYVIGFLLLIVVLFPNNVGAGMVTNRLVIYFWIFSFFLIKKHVKFNLLHVVASTLIFIGFFVIQNKSYYSQIKKYAAVGKDMHDIGGKIEPGKSVWFINFSDEWFVGHSSNYANLASKSIAAENYEANNKWFPISWTPKYEKLGEEFTNHYYSDTFHFYTDFNTDYLLFYGQPPNRFQDKLQSRGAVVDERGLIKLYKIRH